MPISAAVPDGHTTVSLIVPRDMPIPLALVVAIYLSLSNTDEALSQFRLLSDVSGVETCPIFLKKLAKSSKPAYLLYWYPVRQYSLSRALQAENL